MSQAVDAILQQIERLDEAERLALERRLLELAENAWTREAERARSDARQRGIDQQAVDEAAKDVRYGLTMSRE